VKQGCNDSPPKAARHISARLIKSVVFGRISKYGIKPP
jgi:hypothetical protein